MPSDRPRGSPVGGGRSARRCESRGRVAGAAMVLALFVTVTFLPLRNNLFVSFDDPGFITENPMVGRGISAEGAVWAFTTARGGNWIPLTWLSHMTDVTLFGLSPAAHHLGGLLLHVTGTVLLFLSLLAMTGRLFPPLLAAALFGIHPLHVESVAWASERKDVLSGALFMLTLFLYARYAKRPGPRRLAAVVLSFSLALLAKPMAVSLPLVLLLLDFWPLGRFSHALQPSPPPPRWGRLSLLVREKAPLLALSALVSAATVWAQSFGGNVGSMKDYPLAERLANTLIAAATYLVKTVWPAALSPFYPWRAGGMARPAALLAALMLGAITWAAVRGARRRPAIAVGWLWYLVTLLPVAGLMQVGAQAMADRYTYLPLIGPFVAVAWALTGPGLERVRKALRAAALAGLAALSLVAARQVTYWRDDLALYGHAVSIDPANYLAHNNLGMALDATGRPEEAERHYRESLRVNPRNGEAYNNLAISLASRGDRIGALRFFEQAVEVEPGLAKAHVNLGQALWEQGRKEESLRQFEEAVRLDPLFAPAHFGVGVLLEEKGRIAEAADRYREALRLNPAFAEAASRLARITSR